MLDGTVRLGDLEFRRPRVAFMDPMPGRANIGMDVLRDYVLTLDQASGTVALRDERQADIAARSPRGERRLGLRLRGMSGESLRHVAGVDPGSLAVRAGFAAGDTMLSINGRSIDEFDVRELAALFRSNEPLRFAIQREGDDLELEIP